MAGIELAAFLLAAANPSAPAFEFRGDTAGVETKFSKRGFCTETSGEWTCLEKDVDLAGARIGDLVTTHYEGKLASIYATFPSSLFDTLREAFTAKYGSPCEVNTEPWQSRIGVKTESAVVSWCFKTGALRLESVGARLGQGRFIYADQWQAPKPAPTVDF